MKENKKQNAVLAVAVISVGKGIISDSNPSVQNQVSRSDDSEYLEKYVIDRN